ncbi:MAG: acyl-CoA thioesterase [Verrucomicrobia bacterium]|nr:acyl-CoA thioesterase [Verrucomicrobiota bacterium]
MQFIRSRRLIPSLTILFFVVCFPGSGKSQIVAFGASNVAGRGVLPGQAWPAQLEKLLKDKGYNVHVKNAGFNGETTPHMLSRINSAIPPGTKIVILDLSGGLYNNSKKTSLPPEKGEADMRAIEDRIKSRGITIVPESTNKMPLAYRQIDRVHLNPEGHRLFAEQLLPQVIRALNGARSR